jgi:hypothetical protein
MTQHGASEGYLNNPRGYSIGVEALRASYCPWHVMPRVLLFLLNVGHSVYMLVSCASHGRTRCSLLHPHRPSAHALKLVGATSTLAQ